MRARLVVQPLVAGGAEHGLLSRGRHRSFNTGTSCWPRRPAARYAALITREPVKITAEAARPPAALSADREVALALINSTFSQLACHIPAPLALPVATSGNHLG
jgi:hypothetical protein